MNEQKRKDLNLRREREERLSKAFGVEWAQLTNKERSLCLDEYEKVAGENRKDPVHLLDTIFEKRIGFGLFFLALLLGVATNLIASAIDRGVLQMFPNDWQQAVYLMVVLIFFYMGVTAVNRTLEDITSDDLRSGKFLESLLDRVRSKSTNQGGNHGATLSSDHSPESVSSLD